MKFEETKIEGVLKVHFFNNGDERGMFVKPFHQSTFRNAGLETNFSESFYSTSQKNVLRGMHFQKPPFDHAKLVYCNVGKLNDVILDLRKHSTTFGESISIQLSGNSYTGVYIPSGCAHGFEVLENNTMMTYLTSTEHSPEHDSGILWNSFGHEWEVDSPILSKRDQEFLTFQKADELFF